MQASPSGFDGAILVEALIPAQLDNTAMRDYRVPRKKAPGE